MKKYLFLLFILTALFIVGCGEKEDEKTPVEPTPDVPVEPTPEQPEDPTVPEHEHKYTENVVAPTCESVGYTEHVCECGDSYKDNEVAATGHSYGEWKTVKEPQIGKPGLKEKVCACGDKVEEEIPALEITEDTMFDIIFDVDGGVLPGSYASLEELGDAFIADFNKYGNTNATKANFLKDSTASVKDALSKPEMLEKWHDLFVYMLDHLTEYNTAQNTISDEYCSYCLDLLPKLIAGDTEVIKDMDKGPNFRTLVRSYLHGMMNGCKGDMQNNATFAVFAPDFGDEEVANALLDSFVKLETKLKYQTVLPIPKKEYYKFAGWMNDDGEIVEKVNMGGYYTAMWEEISPVDKVEIKNKVDELMIYDSYQLEWNILPGDTINKKVIITSSNPNIASIDENGYITALRDGITMIKVKTTSSTGVYDEFKLTVSKPGYFEISYDTTSYVIEGHSISLNAKYILKKQEITDLKWESLDNTLATVENGYVSGLKEGSVTIRASLKDNSEVFQDFLVTVISENTYNAYSTIFDAHESNVYKEEKLPIGAGTPAYYADIYGSVSDLLFNDELVINTKYNKATNDKYGSDLESRRMESIEFITVHYTGNMNKGADGEANASYFALPLASNNTSIHYCTGNDGVFKGLDEEFRAAHAGDSGAVEGYDSTSIDPATGKAWAGVGDFEWLSTGVKAPDGVTPHDLLNVEVTVSDDCYYVINGQKTTIKLPSTYKYKGRNLDHTYNDKGQVINASDKSVRDAETYFNDMGFRFIVEDGEYKMGKTWWCYTQVYEGRICSTGGNYNSIGIESAVDLGSDLWYTWQKTAQLVADLMYRHNLDISRVVGHHYYTAKDCPQPMLANELRVWYKFIELIEAEYSKIVKLNGKEISFACDSELVDNKGRVLKQGLNSEVVKYTVTVKDGNNTKTIELATIVGGLYNE